jgi:hypothetical protein
MERPSQWMQLLRIARALIQEVNAEQPIIDYWTLGGGTAMMLQIDHRISHDIDIFLPDPQLLPFLDPQKHDFDFALRPTTYHGDGVGFLKLTFDDIGEIDFIVRQAMTETPASRFEVEGEAIWLETIPEIVTKKIVYRGAMVMPRDVFDIAAAGETHADAMIAQLRVYRDATERTLSALEKANPEFVRDTIARLAISLPYKPLADTALERTREILRAV